MSSDRPLFDDEELPAWMQKGGIEPEASGDSSSTPESDDLSWLDEAAPDAETPAQAATSDNDLPWLADAAPASSTPDATPTSDMPAWAQDPEGSGLSPFDLDKIEASQSKPGVTSALPWREGASSPSQSQAPTPWADDNASNTSGTPDASNMDWLNQSDSDSSGSNAPEPPKIKSLKPLPSQPSTPAQPPASDAPRPAIKRLGEAPTPPAAPAPGAIKKLPGSSASSQPAQPPADISGMSYTEWEQAQNAPPPEPELELPDASIDEVPDWFQSKPESDAAKNAASAGPEFMPDWFVGMEEQPADAAPDWFKDMDMSGTPLVGPETVPSQSSSSSPSSSSGSSGGDQPPAGTPPAASADEVPDWFKGSGVADVEGLDFNAMFAADAPPEPPAQPIQPQSPEPSEPMEPMAEMPEMTATDEPEDVSPVPESPELDWMSDMPELDDLLVTEDSQESQSEAQAEPELAESSLSTSMPETESTSEPDWFAGQPAAIESMPEPSAESGAAVEEPAADMSEAEPTEMPDWMAQMAAEPATAPQAESAADVQTGDMPDWMHDMAAAEPTPMDQMDQAEPAPAEAPSEVDWLADFAAGADMPGVDMSHTDTSEMAPAEPAAPVPTMSGTGGDIDIDALLNFAEAASTANAEAAKSAAETQAANMDFDLDNDLDTVLGPAGDEPVTAAPGSGPHEFDVDALTAALAAAANPEPVSTTKRETGTVRRLPPALDESADISAGTASEGELAAEVPEWLADKNPVGPVVMRIGDQEVRFQDRPVNILPEPLQQLRTKTRATARKPADMTAVSSGPLSGITGALDMAPEAVYPSQSALDARMVVSDLEARRIKIIQDILGVEEEMLRDRAMSDDEREAKQAAAGVKRSTPNASPIKWDRAVVTLVLVLGIIVPFFTGILNVTAPVDSSQLSPEQTNVAQAMDGIGSEQSVLVAFEYGPTGAGELDDLARAVLLDIVKHGAHPVIVSSSPAGAMHAEEMVAALGRNATDLDLMGRTGKPLIARQDYSVLRYLPGGSIGVRSLLNAVIKGSAAQIEFATDIEGQPSGVTDVSVNTLSHNPAFILTENPEDVRNWVELYRVEPPLDPLRIVLLSSASASAVAQTYASGAADHRIIGPLVGLRDAIIYQAARNPVADDKVNVRSAQRWQSIGLGTLLAALLILIGTVYYALRGFQRRIRR